MSVFTALFTGVSGLNAQSARTQVIGNNIANMSTNGFKSSRMVFEDILSQSLSGASSTSQLGRGVSVAAVTKDFSQGSLETTNVSTDMAIDGDGFFLVNNGTGDFYTRAGQFSFDANGNIVNPQGYILQGDVYSNGVASGTRGDINFLTTNSPPSTTTEFSIGANLDSRASAATTFSTTLTVYDSLGTNWTLTLTFTKSGSTPPSGTTAEWSLVPSINDTGATVTINGAASATIGFDEDGLVNSPASDPTIMVSGLSNGASMGVGTASSGTVTYDLIGNTAGNRLTGFASSSAVNAISQNGYATGSLLSVSVNQSGIITGLFSNGQTESLAEISLAKFSNAMGLTSVGNNLYAESYSSGPAIVSTAEQSGLGSITSNALELSNVDLSREFVNLILTQRAFQANSTIITTGDEMLADLVNLAR